VTDVPVTVNGNGAPGGNGTNGADAEGGAFEVFQGLEFAIASDDVLRPVDRVTKADCLEGDIHTAQLAGNGVTKSGDESHRV
jgi:hypothetical protein